MACTECCVCLEAPRACVLRPCNHLCVCATCAQVSFSRSFSVPVAISLVLSCVTTSVHLAVSFSRTLSFTLLLFLCVCVCVCVCVSLHYSVYYCLALYSRKYSRGLPPFHTRARTHTHTTLSKIHAPQHSCILLFIRNCGKGRGPVRCAECLFMMYSLYTCKHL
jgi:hypothetical protein